MFFFLKKSIKKVFFTSFNHKNNKQTKNKNKNKKTAQFWAKSFIDEIKKVASAEFGRASQYQCLARADILTIVRDYHAANRRVLLFGYEGVVS